MAATQLNSGLISGFWVSTLIPDGESETLRRVTEPAKPPDILKTFETNN